jgi:glycosyltransferase involved in cell wall biosynthesis
VRIGLIIYGSLNQHSGGYLYDRKLVEALRKKGHRVIILSQPFRNYFLRLLENFSNDLIEKIRSQTLDLLIEDELNHPSSFLLNKRLMQSTDLPIISIVHHLKISENHPVMLNLIYRVVEKAYLSNVQGFIFNSETTKRTVMNLIGAVPQNIVATPGADRLRPRVSTTQIRKRTAHGSPLRIAFVGSLTQRKAPHLILEAMKLFPLGFVEASFAGDISPEPDYAAGLKSLAHKLGLDAQVTFLGHLSESHLSQLLAGSDVLAVPSFYEGFGIAYLEGMGFGLPAIGTRNGAADEIIQNGQNGYLISPGDSAQLAKCLEKLSRDRNLLIKMSLNARKTYLARNSWQKSMDQIIKFLSFYNRQSSRELQPRRLS